MVEGISCCRFLWHGEVGLEYCAASPLATCHGGQSHISAGMVVVVAADLQCVLTARSIVWVTMISVG